MYKVTNKADDVRKIRDKHLGKDVLIEPGKSVFVIKSPEEHPLLEIESVEEKKEQKTKTKTKKEVN